jgi:large subunit ribosomal protein L21
MSKIAVIKTGGKQYLVKAKDKIKVEKLDKKDGSKVSFDTLMISGSDGKELKLGTPSLKDSKVEANIITAGRAKKIDVVHYKNKTRQYKMQGHRQPFTQVEILSIN